MNFFLLFFGINLYLKICCLSFSSEFCVHSLSLEFSWSIFHVQGVPISMAMKWRCPSSMWQYEVNPLFSSISKTLKGWIFPPEKLTEILINLTIFPFIINNNIIVQMFDISVNVNDPKKGDNIWKVHESYNIIGTPCRSIQGVLGLFLGV